MWVVVDQQNGNCIDWLIRLSVGPDNTEPDFYFCVYFWCVTSFFFFFYCCYYYYFFFFFYYYYFFCFCPNVSLAYSDIETRFSPTICPGLNVYTTSLFFVTIAWGSHSNALLPPKHLLLLLFSWAKNIITLSKSTFIKSPRPKL